MASAAPAVTSFDSAAFESKLESVRNAFKKIYVPYEELEYSTLFNPMPVQCDSILPNEEWTRAEHPIFNEIRKKTRADKRRARAREIESRRLQNGRMTNGIRCSAALRDMSDRHPHNATLRNPGDSRASHERHQNGQNPSSGLTGKPNLAPPARPNNTDSVRHSSNQVWRNPEMLPPATRTKDRNVSGGNRVQPGPACTAQAEGVSLGAPRGLGAEREDGEVSSTSSLGSRKPPIQSSRPISSAPLSLAGCRPKSFKSPRADPSETSPPKLNPMVPSAVSPGLAPAREQRHPVTAGKSQPHVSFESSEKGPQGDSADSRPKLVKRPPSAGSKALPSKRPRPASQSVSSEARAGSSAAKQCTQQGRPSETVSGSQVARRSSGAKAQKTPEKGGKPSISGSACSSTTSPDDGMRQIKLRTTDSSAGLKMDIDNAKSMAKPTPKVVRSGGSRDQGSRVQSHLGHGTAAESSSQTKQQKVHSAKGLGLPTAQKAKKLLRVNDLTTIKEKLLTLNTIASHAHLRPPPLHQAPPKRAPKPRQPETVTSSTAGPTHARAARLTTKKRPHDATRRRIPNGGQEDGPPLKRLRYSHVISGYSEASEIPKGPHPEAILRIHLHSPHHVRDVFRGPPATRAARKDARRLSGVSGPGGPSSQTTKDARRRILSKAAVSSKRLPASSERDAGTAYDPKAHTKAILREKLGASSGSTADTSNSAVPVRKKRFASQLAASDDTRPQKRTRSVQVQTHTDKSDEFLDALNSIKRTVITVPSFEKDLKVLRARLHHLATEYKHLAEEEGETGDELSCARRALAGAYAAVLFTYWLNVMPENTFRSLDNFAQMLAQFRERLENCRRPDLASLVCRLEATVVARVHRASAEWMQSHVLELEDKRSPDLFKRFRKQSEASVNYLQRAQRLTSRADEIIQQAAGAMRGESSGVFGSWEMDRLLKCLIMVHPLHSESWKIVVSVGCKVVLDEARKRGLDFASEAVI